MVSEEGIFTRLQRVTTEVSYGPLLIETLKGCLQINPFYRITADELEKSELFSIRQTKHEVWCYYTQLKAPAFRMPEIYIGGRYSFWADIRSLEATVTETTWIRLNIRDKEW